MPDNLNIRGPQDPTKINVNEPWEVRYWTTKWNVTPEQLKLPVKAVGVRTPDVARYLGKNP